MAGECRHRIGGSGRLQGNQLWELLSDRLLHRKPGGVNMFLVGAERASYHKSVCSNDEGQVCCLREITSIPYNRLSLLEGHITSNGVCLAVDSIGSDHVDVLRRNTQAKGQVSRSIEARNISFTWCSST